MEKILAEILTADKNILARRDDLIATLDEKVPGNLSRDYTPIKKAINLNVAEIFFVNDLDTAKAEAAEILKSSGMQEARINFVIDTFANAIELQNKKIAEAEQLAKQAEEAEQKISQPVQNITPPPTFPTPPAPIIPPQQNSQTQTQQNFQPQPQPVQNVPAQPDNTKKILIGVIGVLVIALFVLIGNKSSDNNSAQTAPPVQENFQSDYTENNSAPTSQSERDIVRQTTQNYHNAKTDLNLNGMDLEMSADELENILGSPREFKTVEDHTRYIYSDNFYASVKNGKVDAFVTHDADFKTYRGVHVGSTYSDVAGAYGTNSMDMEHNGMMLYEYPFTSQEGNKGLLRFAVKNGIVDYISVRIIETNSPPPQQNNNIDQNTKNAATAFVNFHRAITDKDFYAAFNYFSEDRKRKMKNDVQAFSKGYTETMSSEVTDLKLVSTSDSLVVLNYILDARDRMSDGSILYQQFSGQVEMVKEYGEWKISNAKSKKIK